jgi:ribonuclease-3
VSPADPSPLDLLQRRLGYAFRTPSLLEKAVTHPSYRQDHPGSPGSNQRLEFLGDAVLQLILTRRLFEIFPDEREGVLTKRRAVLTKGAFLSQIARDLGLEGCLRMGASEEATGGRKKASALEDVFEALVGAIFLDSDLAAVSGIVLGIYGPLPDRLSGAEDFENPKGRLQELIQPGHGNDALRYEVVATEGAEHARAFEIVVSLHNRPLGRGRGPSKKQAEEAAARAALVELEKDPALGAS